MVIFSFLRIAAILCIYARTMNMGLLGQFYLGATLYLERSVGQIRLGNDVVNGRKRSARARYWLSTTKPVRTLFSSSMCTLRSKSAVTLRGLAL